MSLDIIIPVYNEGENILGVLDSFEKDIRCPFRVLICYDHDNDNTLIALKKKSYDFDIIPVKNQKQGVHGAVVTGFQYSASDFVIVYPADDLFNSNILDPMLKQAQKGSDIVVASRFIPGGCMDGAPFLKNFLVKVSAWTLYYLARLPVHDASNGLRLFSKRVLAEIPIESSQGFVYSIELLVKTHRRGWKITEIPAKWVERTSGKSRFQLVRWVPAYLRWYFYAFATIFVKCRLFLNKKNEKNQA